MKVRNYFAVEEDGQKTYMCLLCDKNFNDLKEVIRHVQGHFPKWRR